MKKNMKNAKAYIKPKIKNTSLINKAKVVAGINRKNATPRRQDVKLHQHLLERFKTKKEIRMRKRAEYLASLPKGRINKLKYILHPKRVAKFVFSREGLMLGLKTFGIAVVLGMVLMFVVFAYYRKDLPKNITDLRSCSQGQKTSYYDRTGEVLLWRGEGDVDCQPVALANMSDYLKKAVISAEDQNFYKHPGFDVKGTLRAALSNAKGSDAQQGGSTITQQYVKLAVLSNNEKRLSRKIKELILSIELERTYKKDEILQAYLNEVSFGSVYNGAEAAAQGFFNKPAKDLTLDEAATFAAAIQAPGNYWDNNQEGLIERRNNYVLENMVSLGYIKRDEADAAKKVDTLAKVSKNKNMYKDIKAAHFVIEVQNQLEQEFGSTNIRRQGYKVITTLDMEKQGFAETAVANGMNKIDSTGFDNAALVSEEVSTGQVVAYIGSRDFNYPGFGQKNIAGTPRSPGSSVKPYDYANLMKNSENWGAGSIMYDWKTVLPGWGTAPNDQLTDYGNNPGVGPATMRYFLGNSKNIPAIKSIVIAGKGDGIAGITSMHNLMKSMGVESGWTNCGIPCDQTIATGIGDGGEIRLDEHVHGITTFSRMGKKIPQLYVLKILDAKGKVIRDNTKEPVAEQVLDPQIAYIINDMLSDGDASYFRSKSRAARELNGFQDHVIPTAIKTGTTNNNENGWMMGYTPDFVTGVWTGNHENKSTRFEGMHFLTGPIWGEYMRLIYQNRETPAKWPKPEGIKTVTLDSAFYKLVKSACGGDRTCNYGPTDIYPSWYTPKKTSNNQEKVVIDTVSGKRATSCTPESARKEITGGGIITPELDPGMPYYKEFMAPITLKLKATGTEAIPAENELDTIHSCDDVKPSATLSIPANCNGSCTISVNVVRGTHALKNLYIKMDGTTMSGGAMDIGPDDDTYTLPFTPESSGSHTFTAQVVDQVLYDTTSDPKTSNLTPDPFVFQSAVRVSSTKAKLTWSNLNFSGAPYTIHYRIGATNGTRNVPACSGPTLSGSNCVVDVDSLTANSTVEFWIESSGGRETDTRTLSLAP